MSFVNCGTDEDSSGTMTRLIDEAPSRDPRRGLTSPALGYIRAYHIRGVRSARVLSPEKGACDMRAFRMRIVHASSRGCKGAAEGEDEERSWMATHGHLSCSEVKVDATKRVGAFQLGNVDCASRGVVIRRAVAARMRRPPPAPAHPRQPMLGRRAQSARC